MGSEVEKRQFVRLNLLADITYTRRASSANEKISLTRNISKGGICFIAYEKLNEGEMLDLSIFIPEQEKPIAATGKIAWIKEFIIGDPEKGKRYDVGIEFIKVSDGELAKIDKYIGSNLA
jgi:c-di-GMP-binding flagellar brake protein YcgR